MRKYDALDLIRFHNLASEFPDIRPANLIAKYNEKYPEKTEKEKLINLAIAFDINGLYKALTGEDIPEDKRVKWPDEDDEEKIIQK